MTRLPSTVSRRYRLGDFEIDLERTMLLRDGVEVALRAKAFALLAYLVRRRGEVVSKEELFAAIWPGVRISEATLASTLRAVREALGGDEQASVLVRTLRGRGYRLEAALDPLVASAPGTTGPLARAAAEPAFVGRSDLLAVGQAALDDAVGERARLLVLAGEAGIGKSRALHELGRLAAGTGFAIHSARCREEEGAPAFWPWIQVLRGALAELPAAERTALIERHAQARVVLPDYPDESGGTSPAHDQGGAAARFQIFEAIAALLRELAGKQPRAIVIDDLHRADAASADLLRHLVASLADAPLAVIGSLRGNEVPPAHAMARLMEEIHTHGTRLDMRALDAGEVGHMIESIWQRAPLQRVAEAVHVRSGGNPLFVGEIARLLDRDGTRESADEATAAAPAGVRQIIRARMSGLPADSARILEMASVLGREVPLDVLRRMCAADGSAPPEAALEAARDAQFLIEEPPGSGRLFFSHILVRDALYRNLSLERRTALHRSAGLAIEALHPLELTTYADELAHHFGQALLVGEAARAQRFARLAGETALLRAAYPEAGALFEAALRALERRAVDAKPGGAPAGLGHERIELQILLGRATWLAGATEVAREIFREAAHAASEAQLPDLLAQAALGYAGRTDATPGVNRESVTLMESALEMLPAEDQPLRAELLARLGTELYYDAGSMRSEELTRESVGMAARLGEPGLLAYALSAHHVSLMRADVDPRRRIPLLERLYQLAYTTEARDTLAIGLLEEFADRLELGERSRLDAVFRDCDRIAQELRQPFFLWMTSAYAGCRALLDGRLTDAERIVHETLELGQDFNTPNAVPLFAGQLFHLRLEQGRSGELEPLILPVIESQDAFPSFRAGLAAIQATLGRKREAAATLADLMVDDLNDVPRDSNFLMLLALMTEPAVALREETTLRRIGSLLEPFAGRIVVGGHGGFCQGAVDHHLAVIAAALDDPYAAQEAFEAAESIHGRLGARLWLAHTQREHASLLWKHGAPHERERARELADEACGAYLSAGVQHRVEATRAALR